MQQRSFTGMVSMGGTDQTRHYSDEHVETIMRRAVATRLNRSKLLNLLTIFSGSVQIEGVHPLQFGFVRRKVRTQRRYGMPIVHPPVFYPWRLVDFGKAFTQWLRLYLRYYRVLERIKKDPASSSYVDEALRLHSGAGDADKLVEAFADKIPHTHGAPVRVAVAVQSETISDTISAAV
jgi:hypothetical protein